jgi:hypothetical protein
MADNEMSMGFGGYGFLVVIILVLLILFGGGGCMGNLFNRGGNCGYNNGPGAWDVERREMIDSAQTQYRVIDENRRSTDLISAQLRNQWDAEQGEKMFDLKLNALAMQQGYEAKLIAKDATIERMTLAHEVGGRFDALAAQIADIRCNMLPRPQVYGIGTSCNSIITPPLQTYGGYGGCCNGNVGGGVVVG